MNARTARQTANTVSRKLILTQAQRKNESKRNQAIETLRQADKCYSIALNTIEFEAGRGNYSTRITVPSLEVAHIVARRVRRRGYKAVAVSDTEFTGVHEWENVYRVSIEW